MSASRGYLFDSVTNKDAELSRTIFPGSLEAVTPTDILKDRFGSEYQLRP